MIELPLLTNYPDGIKGILLGILIFFPAGISNMAPLIANKIPGYNRWNATMDFGKSFRGIRIFGDHKTWRGFVAGTFAGTFLGTLMYIAIAESRGVEITLPEYAALACALSAGALVGDAVKSFFKRRSNVPSGKSWFPFDQLDYIVGALVFALPFGLPPLLAVTVVPVFFAGHLLSTYLGYLFKFKDAPI